MEESTDNKQRGSVLNTPFFQAILDAVKREQQDEIYLNELANKYVPKEPKNYLSVRSIVLDVHFRLEGCINMSIASWLCFFGKKDISFSEDEVSNILDAISNIEYAKKLKIVERLKIFSSSSITTFWKTNDLRVAFAHNYKKESPKYLYYNKTIFKRESIDKLTADLKAVIKEFVKFLG